MIELGNYNTLGVLRSTSVGVFLGDDDGTEILLPNKYVPENVQIDDKLKVFCYLDHMERPIATTLTPHVQRNRFGFLKVAEVNQFGAFLDWGLEKHLLVPFREQRLKMQEGNWYVVFCYLDEQSFRLVASNKLDKFLSNDNLSLQVNDEVSALVSRKTDLGWEVIIDNKHKGLLFYSDVFRPISIGLKLTCFVKHIREDNKIDIALQPIGSKMLDTTAENIYDELVANNGFLPLNDKSDPELIKKQFQISKKAFKKGIGVLYRNRKILIKDDGIYVVPD
ncbi:CvfB family protein [Croceitalea rosinachiae]|uniref:S1-like domain-containing RNA-binding protein n=1 Tax=Croceitalea rosinachiae TaxID=3075596 RepID=A0ABU3AB03_9FLAO|nr:S1-like domain-containing RNA-binding protein [Croceitalea sp. F388]MDT0607361.1 S1-like domain-containing RNA-binding protein [Croceitalea sp. F388]